MNDIIKEKFKDALIVARKKKVMSQTDLAKAIHRSTSLVCDIEKGRKKPSMPVMVEIAKVLEISLDSTFLK
ncbi:helix-turn-helix transcriptional regulator [Clostridium akagii]|uniref:helix-turn-helix transcriptional regulator n=1 Tax=Clostridium akagii TaxID=91623 RepID=UPI0005634AF9|nr:helix-turn-helix transcriptional regulator [Clostridium akagii]